MRRGNYSDPASLDTAFAGADKLLIVSYPSIAHAERVANHKNAIDAASRAVIKHIYYTSLAFASDSKAAVMQAHLDTEKYLKESGLTYTILREGIYSESYPLYFGFWSPGEGNDEVLVPYSDGGIAWVSREDLGEGTAKIMVEVGAKPTMQRWGASLQSHREDTRTRLIYYRDHDQLRLRRSRRRSHSSLGGT